MKYQIALQWPLASSDAFDAMLAVENALIEGLGDSAEVDGHDLGSGEANIFVRTDDPEAAFTTMKAILGSFPWQEARVAYREVKGKAYTVLWPLGLREFTVR